MKSYKYDVFISYKSQDGEFAKEVYEFLSKSFKVFFAQDTLKKMASDDFENYIKESLRSSLILLNVGTNKENLNGEWLKKERDYFKPLRDMDSNRRIFNIVSNDFEIPLDLPDDLKEWNSRRYDHDKKEIEEFIKNSIEAVRIYENSLEDSNYPSDIEFYKNDIKREDSLKLLEDFINSLDTSTLTLVYGMGGVGKSSFLTSAFLEFKKREYQTYIYYIKGLKEYKEHLEDIFVSLKKKFKKVAFENDIKIDFDDISQNQSLEKKFSELFHLYDHIYKKCGKRFVLFVDGVDMLEDVKRFIYSLVHSVYGVDFVFSARGVVDEEFLNDLKDQKRVNIYADKTFGLKLKNLDQSKTLEFLKKHITFKDELTKAQRAEILNAILKKSSGLPKYFELLIAKINDLLQSDISNKYEKILLELDESPFELNNYYIKMFSSLEKESPLCLEILKVLYWFKEGVKKDFVIEILNLDISEFNKAIKSMQHLIKINSKENTIAINHLSIEDALFSFFEKGVDEKLSAKKINKPLLQKIFKKNELLYEFAAVYDDIYLELGFAYYFKDENPLFETLKRIVEFYLVRAYVDPSLVMDIYFEYAKALFFKEIFSSDILTYEDSTLDRLFKPKLPLKNSLLYEFNLAVYRQFIDLETMDIYDFKKLFVMSVLDQNSYFQAKYLRYFLYISYKRIYDELFKLDVLKRKRIEELGTNLSRTYIALRSKIEGKQLHSDIALYDDGRMIYLYNNTKSKNIYAKVFATMVSDQKRKKNRNFLEKQQRYYKIISSGDLKIKREFFKTTLYNFKRLEKNSKKDKDFLAELAFDILYEDMNLKDDKLKRFLSIEQKSKINRIYQIINSYKQNSINSILKEKNIEFLKYVVVHLKDEDRKKLLDFAYTLLSDHDLKLFQEILYKTIRVTQDRELLLVSKEYLQKFLDQTGEGALLNLLYIFYKLDDLDALKSLQKDIIEKEFSKKQRSLLSNIIAKIENNFSKSWDILSKHKTVCNEAQIISYLSKSKYSIDELEFFQDVIKENKRVNSAFVDAFYRLEDKNRVTLVKEKTMELSLISKEDIKLWSIAELVFVDMKMFLDEISKFDFTFQIEFLDRVITSSKRSLIFEDNFFSYILKLISENEIDEKVIKLFEKICFYNSFFEFVDKNYDLVYRYYIQVPEYSEEQKYYKAMLYRNLLALDDEKDTLCQKLSEFELEDMQKVVKIVSSFIFVVDDKSIVECIIKRVELLKKSCDVRVALMKLYLHTGLRYGDKKYVKDGIKRLFMLNTAAYKTEAENFIKYSLSNYVDEFTHTLMIDLFAMEKVEKFNFINYIYAQKLLENSEFSKDFVDYPDCFAIFYMKYFDQKERLSLEDLDLICFDGVLDSFLTVLYDRYKEAEIIEDEESYEYYLELFEKLKTRYESKIRDMVEEFETLTLDNFFQRLSPKKEDQFDISLINYDYPKFYEHIKALLESGDSESFDNILKEIKSNDDLLNSIYSKTSIRSKLQLKASNIEMMKEKK